MHKHLKRMLVLTAGVLLVISGLLGLVLPLVPGVPLLIIGALLLSLYSPAIRAWMDVHTKKYPHLNAIVERVEAWIVRIIGRP